MQKAFLFDLDGVLINNELVWEKHKKVLYEKYFGAEVTKKLGSTLGVNMDKIFELAVALGATVDKKVLFDAFFETASSVYVESPLTKNLDLIFSYLKMHNYRIGIVSASPIEWINIVLARLKNKKDIEIIISLHEYSDLRHKPHPDGYNYAMKQLGVDPSNTFVLEDSNSGIESAKASSAFTIGFQENLVEGYKQSGANAYAKDISEVIKLLMKFQKTT